MRTKALLCGALAVALMVAGFAGSALADPKGVWLSGSGKSHVKLGACAAERFWAPSDTIGSGNELSDATTYSSQFSYGAGS